MNDFNQDHDTLWRDLYRDGPAKRSLDTLLLEAKRKRRRRAGVPLVLAAAAVLALAMMAWWATPWKGGMIDPPPVAEGNRHQIPTHEEAPPLPRRKFDQTPPPNLTEDQHAPQPNWVASVGAKEISDEELLDRLKGWPVALVGPKGKRKAVFLEPTGGGE